MKRTLIILMITSLIILFYAAYINVQGNYCLAVMSSFPESSNGAGKYQIENIEGASRALIANSWLVIALALINSVICGYALYRNRKRWVMLQKI